MENKKFSLIDFLGANPDRTVSRIDYIHAVYKIHDVPSDFIISMMELVSPTFIEIDGLAFISSQFNKDEYQKMLSEGHTVNAAQFWLNLLEISGLFEDVETETCLELGQVLCEAWNLKLLAKFPNTCELARVIHDHETNEVFIVVGRLESELA